MCISNKPIVSMLFRKLKPDAAIKFIRKTFWKAESNLKLLQSVIELKEKENITLEEALDRKIKSYQKLFDEWKEIREEAEAYIIE